MRALSHAEGATLTALRHLNARACCDRAVPTYAIRSRAWDHERVPYDSVHRALNNLVALGLAEKVRRGYWRPTDVESGPRKRKP